MWWLSRCLKLRASSRPAKRRPVMVVSADTYNASRLATVIAVVITVLSSGRLIWEPCSIC